MHCVVLYSRVILPLLLCPLQYVHDMMMVELLNQYKLGLCLPLHVWFLHQMPLVWA